MKYNQPIKFFDYFGEQNLKQNYQSQQSKSIKVPEWLEQNKHLQNVSENTSTDFTSKKSSIVNSIESNKEINVKNQNIKEVPHFHLDLSKLNPKKVKNVSHLNTFNNKNNMEDRVIEKMLGSDLNQISKNNKSDKTKNVPVVKIDISQDIKESKLRKQKIEDKKINEILDKDFDCKNHKPKSQFNQIKFQQFSPNYFGKTKF